MTMKNLRVKTIGLLLLAAISAPTAAAEIEAGACGWKGECTWIDNNGSVHHCESNGNVAVIAGEDNHVNYCHDESNSTASGTSFLVPSF